MPRNSITIALDKSRENSALRHGTEDLAVEVGDTISAIGSAALTIAIADPHLIEPYLSRRSSGRCIARK